MKISRNRSVRRARQQSYKEKVQPWERNKKTKNILFQQTATKWITEKKEMTLSPVEYLTAEY